MTSFRATTTDAARFCFGAVQPIAARRGKAGQGSYRTVSLIMDRKHVAFSGRLVFVGFGSIGQGVLPLLLRHLVIDPGQITIITAEPRGNEVAAEYSISF